MKTVKSRFICIKLKYAWRGDGDDDDDAVCSTLYTANEQKRIYR